MSVDGIRVKLIKEGLSLGGISERLGRPGIRSVPGKCTHPCITPYARAPSPICACSSPISLLVLLDLDLSASARLAVYKTFEI